MPSKRIELQKWWFTFIRSRICATTSRVERIKKSSWMISRGCFHRAMFALKAFQSMCHTFAGTNYSSFIRAGQNKTRNKNSPKSCWRSSANLHRWMSGINYEQRLLLAVAIIPCDWQNNCCLLLMLNIVKLIKFLDFMSCMWALKVCWATLHFSSHPSSLTGFENSQQCCLSRSTNEWFA